MYIFSETIVLINKQREKKNHSCTWWKISLGKIEKDNKNETDRTNSKGHYQETQTVTERIKVKIVHICDNLQTKVTNIVQHKNLDTYIQSSHDTQGNAEIPDIL